MKKHGKPIALALALLTSCGGGSATASIIHRDIVWENPYAGTAKETATLSVWAGNSEESIAYLNAIIADFKKANPDSNYTFKVKAVSESKVRGTWNEDPNNAADFAVLADDQFPLMIQDKRLQDLNSLSFDIPALAEKVETRNSPDAIEAVTSKGLLYGFPVSASNGYILYYNSELLSPRDVTSFDTLLSAVKRVSEEKNTDYAFGFPYNSGWYLDGWFHGAGFSATGEADGETIQSDWNGEVGGVKGVDVAGALVKLAHGQYEKYWTSDKEETLINHASSKYRNKRVIATISGTWNYNALKGYWGEGKTGAAVLPTFNVGSKEFRMNSVKGFKIGVVNKNKKDNVLPAMRFAEFYSNYESQIVRFDNLSEAPTNTASLAQCDLDANPAVKAIAEQREIGGFVQKVNGVFWNPSNLLSTQLCEGTAGDGHSFIASGKGSADIVLNDEEIQAALDTCVSSFEHPQ